VRIPTSESNGGIAAWIGAVPTRSERVFPDSALRAGGHGASARARLRTVPLALFAALLVFALAPVSAQALLVHTLSFGSATSTPADPYPLSSPQGVAVDNSTGASKGDVYVVDALNFRVEKFDGSGNFILAFGKGVDQTSGANVCPSAPGDVCQAGTQGTSAGAFEAPQFVAVDPTTGDVYVADPGDDTISKFDSSGNLITTWPSGTPTGQLSGATTFGSIDGITVDNSGNLLVINGGNSVYEFAPDGSAVKNFPTLRGMTPAGLDINNSGILFKVNGDTSVERFDPSGPQPPPDLQVTPSESGTTGLVIDRSSGDLYVDVGTSVGHFVFDPSGNVVETGGTTCAIPPGACAPTDTFGSGVLKSGTGIGFASATTTAYVADAGNNDVAVFVPPSPGKPVIDAESATNVGNQTATLTALVNPFGNATTCTFQYVTNATFQSTGFNSATSVSCPAALGSSFADQSPSVNLTGLALNTEYDFRVVATNSAGTVDGNPATFTTLGPAVIDSETATNVLPTSATLNTEVNPLGNDTSCTFQYVTDADFQVNGYTDATSVPCSPSDLGSGTGDVSATTQLTGLTILTTYHFRVLAKNTLGTETGADQTFATLNAASIDSESASNITQTTAELDTQINPLGTDTSCAFQYVDAADFQATGYASATTVACSPADLGSGTSDVGDSAQISGLTPSTTYHFRAVATNSLGTVDGTDTTFETEPPLSVDSESVSGVTDTGATVRAEINPLGVDTTYQFKYVDDAAFLGSGFAGATVVPVSPVDLGSGSSDVAASVDLTGLSPGTKYHFQVIGTNSFGTVPGKAKSFVTLSAPASSGLPDGRGYELVSPVDMAGGEVHNALCSLCTTQAAPDGNEMAYFSLISFPGSAGPGDNYIASRGAGGWSTQALLPPQAPGTTLELELFIGYSSDLSRAVLLNGGGQAGGDAGQDDPPLVPGTTSGGLPLCSATPLVTPCSGELPNAQNLFVRDNSNGTYQLVDSLAGAKAGVTPSGSPPSATFDGGSADLSHVVFDENTSGGGLTNSPQLAPAGDNLYDWSAGTVNLVGMLPASGATTCSGAACSPVGGGTLGGSGRVLHAVSANGSTVVFTDNGDLYARVNDSTTTQLDAVQGGSGSGGGGQFMDASTDGSVVLFTDAGSAGLTSDTVAGDTNLYEYNFNAPAGHQLTDLTNAGSIAGVDGVVGASSDGSYVYFVAHGVPNSNNENLYVYHSGTTTCPGGGSATNNTCLVAMLNGGDSSDWSGSYTARVTPDGTHLAFNSIDRLTGYDNTDASTGSADTEVFLYDASSGALVCASCNPSGANPIGSSQLDPIEPGLLGGGNEYVQHNLSDDGSRLFFDSGDALSPRDTNGKQDVYEWENGQIYRISTGSSVDDSTFLDASANGDNVFFVTRQQLVPQATDADRFDLYDARVGGGFPAPVSTPPCTGDACKPAPTPPPAPPTVATVSFVGPGNATPGAPPTAQVAVSSSKVLKGFRFSVVVIVPAKGEITISGAGLKTVKKSVKHAGSYKLTVGLTAKQRNALNKKHKRKLKLTVHIGYKPATGSSSSATFSVTVKA
jgi:hypothetical protein